MTASFEFVEAKSAAESGDGLRWRLFAIASSWGPGVRSGDGDLDLARADLTLERRGTVPDERRPGTELERRVAECAEDGVALSRFTHSGTCGPAEISEMSNPLELSRMLSLLLLLVLASVLGR